MLEVQNVGNSLPSSPLNSAPLKSIYNTLGSVRGQGSVSAFPLGMRGQKISAPLPVWEDELYLNFIAAATPLMQIKSVGIVVVKDCCTRQNCLHLWQL